MYKINTLTGDILCEDGSLIRPPYDDPKYQQYAVWVQSGNSPEEYQDATALPVPESVRKYQLRAAMYNHGMLTNVENFISDDNTEMLVKLAWQDSLDFKRDGLVVNSICNALNIPDYFMDELYREAEGIEA
jgi:hypothetical protein